MSAKIQPTHLERVAVVYLRQSDLRKVRNHPESTARQLRDGEALEVKGDHLEVAAKLTAGEVAR